LLVLEPEFKKGMRALAVPDAQEVSADPCGRGSHPDKIEEEFPDRVDFHLVKEGWNSKDGKWEVNNESLEKRTRALRQFIRARPEKEIALVCHGEIMHHFEENLIDKSDDPDSTYTGMRHRTGLTRLQIRCLTTQRFARTHFATMRRPLSSRQMIQSLVVERNRDVLLQISRQLNLMSFAKGVCTGGLLPR